MKDRGRKRRKKGGRKRGKKEGREGRRERGRKEGRKEQTLAEFSNLAMKGGSLHSIKRSDLEASVFH